MWHMLFTDCSKSTPPSSFFKKLILFIYFGLCWVFIAAPAFLELQLAEPTLWIVAVHGFLIAEASLLTEHRLWGVGSVVAAGGLSGCDEWA